MTWDRPRTTGRPPTRDSNVYATAAAHAVSEVVMVTDTSPQPKWAGAVRTLGLLLPSSWVWLTVCLWWAWRLLALYARGDFDVVPMGSTRLLVGLLTDLAIVHCLFTAVRLVALMTAADRGQNRATVVWMTRIMMAAMAASALMRIVDVVLCALEQAPPSVDFWLRLMADPGSVLLQGGVFAAIGTAAATAAVGRYAMNCDLEAAAHLASRMQHRRALALTGASLLAGLLAVGAGSAAVASAGARDWGRSPELYAIRTFDQALSRRQQASLPHLEP